MGELRKDYVLDRWTIIAAERGKRPHDFAKEKTEPGNPKTCFFCPGNESSTPPEIARIKNNDMRSAKKWPWKMRIFPNKFNAVRPEGQMDIKTDNIFYTFSANYGFHEVIVETPDHFRQLWDLEEKDIKQVIDVYCDRINELGKKEGIKYVCVFKNSGKDAGTSIIHSHSQVIAYNKVPEFVQQEAEASKKYATCPYCSIINNEKGSYRRCFENSSFAAFTPYASRFPFEIWIFPKEHVKSIVDLGEKQREELADIMSRILKRLKELNASFNYVIHNAPKGDDLHFHIEVLPRLATWAGFEFSGTVINTESPEEAAKFYRGEQ